MKNVRMIYPENPSQAERISLGLQQAGRDRGSKTILASEVGPLDGMELKPVVISIFHRSNEEFYAVNPGIIILGRHTACDIVIPDDTVSRIQATLTVHTDGRVVVRDLDSYNGLWITSWTLQHCACKEYSTEDDKKRPLVVNLFRIKKIEFGPTGEGALVMGSGYTTLKIHH